MVQIKLIKAKNNIVIIICFIPFTLHALRSIMRHHAHIILYTDVMKNVKMAQFDWRHNFDDTKF